MSLTSSIRTMTGRLLGLLAVTALAGNGCGGGDFGGGDFGGGHGGADFGATPGGVKDMSFARELVANGMVPPAAAFLVEGMFSEHDLGLAGAPCETLLCLRSAVAVAPTLAGEPSGWLQIGMSSTIDPETFERPSLTLVATVDVSGSMGWDYSTDENEYPTPGALSRRLLHALGERLGPQDRIAIVTYGSTVATPLALTAGDDHARIARVIDDLEENGSTNMEAGLERAYQIARDAIADGETEETRIVLFTDEQPNVGATSASDFEQMVGDGAEDGVGITVLGLGLGLGQELMNAMSHLRGGNAFSLTKGEHVDEFIAENWPWFASPIAYDLSMKVTPTEGFALRDRYGFPDGTAEEAGLEVSTVFLSRRKGALLLRIAPEESNGAALAVFAVQATLRYLTLGGEEISLQLDAGYQGQALDARGHYYAQPGTARTLALALLVSGMHEAAALYASDRPGAVELMKLTRDRFAADAEALNDASLTPELELASTLLGLMESGAPQGDLY
jgi:Ca-activated chloride channel family protein